MKVKNSIDASLDFGMGFSRNGLDCNKYLASTFGRKAHKLEKALEALDKKCSLHNHYDMFHSSHDDSIIIIGRTDHAGKKLANVYGNPILSLYKGTEYPNSLERLKHSLDELEKSPHGPKYKYEKFMFKLYRYFYLKCAEIKMNRNPYEFLPANVRKGVDIINELETGM